MSSCAHAQNGGLNVQGTGFFREALGRAGYTHRAWPVQTCSTQLIRKLLQRRTQAPCFIRHKLLARLSSNSSEVKGRNHYPYIQLSLNSDGKIFTTLKERNETSAEVRVHTGVGEHYRYCISTESVTKADSQGLERACLWIRLSALDSPHFGSKPSSEELCIHLSTSSWSLFCLLFLQTTKPATSRKTLSTFPLPLPPTCLSFV